MRSDDLLSPPPKNICLTLAVWVAITHLTLGFSVGIEETEDRLMDSIDGLQCLTMTAENSTSGDLTPVPIVTCKLCLCEQPLDKVTMLQECQCIFCTSVSFP